MNVQTDASEAIRELVGRQARAWERNDFELAADDWHPDGVLVSPGGAWPIGEVREEMRKFYNAHSDLAVEVKNVFTSADGPSSGTGRSPVRRTGSGEPSLAPPRTIIADLKDGKILSWREYFDLSESVEAGS